MAKDLSFCYPITSIELITAVSIKCTARDFEDIEYLGSGSNSNLYTVSYKGKKVVVKMLKEKLKNLRTAEQEIVFEAGILARLNHPNIVKLYGAGEDKRKFIVLEYLEGGTLSKVLKCKIKNQVPVSKPKSIKSNSKGITSTIPLSSIISIAKSIVQALKYLHNDFSNEAVIIHRDLKPQNIGFTKDGQLKLFDFGLMACVKRRVFSHEAYKMTGGTGTLIYMAPEVTLREAYSEMVDIYSFGMILWQMTSGMTPFVGMRHSDYMEEVVNLGHRPKIPEHLPAPLIQVIERCWQKNPLQRPSCAEILDLLEDASTVSMSMPSLMLCGQIKRFLRSNSAKVADEDTLTQQQNAKLISRI